MARRSRPILLLEYSKALLSFTSVPAEYIFPVGILGELTITRRVRSVIDRVIASTSRSNESRRTSTGTGATSAIQDHALIEEPRGAAENYFVVRPEQRIQYHEKSTCRAVRQEDVLSGVLESSDGMQGSLDNVPRRWLISFVGIPRFVSGYRRVAQRGNETFKRHVLWIAKGEVLKLL